jgi:hypothetical protein
MVCCGYDHLLPHVALAAMAEVIAMRDGLTMAVRIKCNTIQVVTRVSFVSRACYCFTHVDDSKRAEFLACPKGLVVTNEVQHKRRYPLRQIMLGL